MFRTDPEIEKLERDAYRIVGMICSEAVPEPEIKGAIQDLRAKTESVFPGRPGVFEHLYGRRFARLSTRFRPSPGLFAGRSTV